MNVRIALAGLAGFLAVVLAAFGAHALPETLPQAQRSAFETAGVFHLAHAILLTALGLAARRPLLGLAYAVIFAGMTIFCGALYAYALSGDHRVALVAPVGGVTLMAGWLAVMAAGVKGETTD